MAMKRGFLNLLMRNESHSSQRAGVFCSWTGDSRLDGGVPLSKSKDCRSLMRAFAGLRLNGRYLHKINKLVPARGPKPVLQEYILDKHLLGLFISKKRKGLKYDHKHTERRS